MGQLNLRQKQIYIIQTYVPRADKEGEINEKFYEDLENAKERTKKQDITIIMGTEWDRKNELRIRNERGDRFR